ncbi:hypothetical protein SO802_008714 [Lithocarpus litseifolius]|uniref:B-like cyclin n=1 Tax=Lithocarpus litseifolius TaxID=425828 RepID=A0AAW2DA01_9ROSI
MTSPQKCMWLERCLVALEIKVQHKYSKDPLLQGRKCDLAVGRKRLQSLLLRRRWLCKKRKPNSCKVLQWSLMLCSVRKCFEGVNGIGEEGSDENVKKHSFFPLVLLENDLVWEDDELVSLKSKEGGTHVCLSSLISDGSLMVARKEALDWILRVKAHYWFCALTAILAVNYFDRFASSLMFKREKPWMAHIVIMWDFVLCLGGGIQVCVRSKDY